MRGIGGGSDRHDLLFLGGVEVVYLLDILVVDLLCFGLGVFTEILGRTVLDGFLDHVDRVAAGIADADFGGFGLLLGVLG